MKKLFMLIALGSTSLLSADQYYQPYGNGDGYCPSCNKGGGYYQEQSNNNYYQQNQRQAPQGWYQRNDQNYQRNQQYDYQQQSNRNQQYNQGQPGNQRYNQQQGNQSYYQQQGNQQGNYAHNYDSQKGNNDQDITKKIQDALSSGWLSKGFQNVSFDVNNGNVNLRGSVDSLADKNKVEDSIRNINGVKQVNNQINIAKTNSDSYSDSQLQDSEKKYPRDTASTHEDRQLNARIRDKLSNGWFSKGNETLIIRTSNGIVIISGTVEKPEDAKKISDQVTGIEGVKSVNNQLSVKNQ